PAPGTPAAQPGDGPEADVQLLGADGDAVVLPVRTDRRRRVAGVQERAGGGRTPRGPARGHAAHGRRGRGAVLPGRRGVGEPGRAGDEALRRRRGAPEGTAEGAGVRGRGLAIEGGRGTDGEAPRRPHAAGRPAPAP